METWGLTVQGNEENRVQEGLEGERERGRVRGDDVESGCHATIVYNAMLAPHGSLLATSHKYHWQDTIGTYQKNF